MALLLLAIAAYDLRYHRIPHLFLAGIALVQYFEKFPIRNFHIIPWLVIVGLALFVIFHVGGGDIKLLSLLLTLVVPIEHFDEFFLGIAISSLLLITFLYLRDGLTPTDIPLAPAILGGYLLALRA